VSALRILRISIYIFFSIYCVTAGSFDSKAESGEPAGRVTVTSDKLAVYSRMSAESEVLRHLKKGDVVTVEFEMERAERAWCAISKEGQITGYVECENLKREKRKIWESTGSSVVGKGSDATKVTIIGNQVLVPVKLGYGGREAEALFLLDTGAGGTAISSEVASYLDIDLDKGLEEV
jgi:hypothetical protein